MKNIGEERMDRIKEVIGEVARKIITESKVYDYIIHHSFVFDTKPTEEQIREYLESFFRGEKLGKHFSTSYIKEIEDFQTRISHEIKVFQKEVTRELREWRKLVKKYGSEKKLIDFYTKEEEK